MRLFVAILSVLSLSSAAHAACRNQGETFEAAKTQVLAFLFNDGVKSVRFGGFGCDNKICSSWFVFQKHDGVKMADQVGEVKMNMRTCKVTAYGYEALGEELFTGAR